MTYTKIPSDCPYSIKSMKTFKGHDGQGYEATIALNGKAILIAVDDGWGGGLQFHPAKSVSSRNGEDQEKAMQEYSALYKAKAEAVAALDTYAKTLPNYDADELFPNGLEMDDELLIGELVNLFEEKKVREKNAKKFAKWCATETLFRLKGDKKGSWRTVKATGLAAGDFLRKKYGVAVEVILTSMSLQANSYAWEGF